MQRDLIGYGNSLPQVVWPKNAQIAINFVLNYEEGSESNVLDGDNESESYLTDWPALVALKNERHLSAESLFEYGSRAGIWRILNLFDSYNISITIFTTGLALERNPPLAEKLKHSQHEIAGHGYRWINYFKVDENLEREHIQKTIQIVQELTQKKIIGWYTGRRSKSTRKLIVEAGLKYDSESYSDDLPYWIHESEHTHLIIPYSLDTNDARYATCPGWNNGEQFLQHLKATFDCLYREGAEHPKMMTIGIHGRLSGRPGRCEALRNFINYIQEFDKVWISRRQDIAEHWYRFHSKALTK